MQTSSVGPKTSTGPSLQPAAATKNAALKTQMVNKTKISLDFQIENAAPTGVVRVDVWLSRDQGQTWQKHAEENGSKSPIEVQFPGDGVYGLILSPCSAATPSTPPTAADQADAVWLEVDATKLCCRSRTSRAAMRTARRSSKSAGTPRTKISPRGRSICSTRRLRRARGC